MSYSSTSTDPAAVAAIFLVMLVIGIVAYVVSSIFTGMLFKKAGVEAWKAWVPFLNSWKLLQIGGLDGFWSLIPGVNGIMVYVAMHNINKKLGYGGGMTAVAILFTLIWLIIVATSKNVWNDSLGEPRRDTPDNPAFGGGAVTQAGMVGQAQYAAQPFPQQPQSVPAPTFAPAQPMMPVQPVQPPAPQDSQGGTPHQPQS